MRIIDASSMIYAWDNYPITHFPKLWDWIAAEIKSASTSIPAAAFAEVSHKVPVCRDWLVNHDCNVVPEAAPILQAAMAIKQCLGIQNDQYHAEGVDENDILIIATAKASGHVVISNERRQPTLPTNMKRWKIPAVCNHPSVVLTCNDFVEYFKGSGKVF